ncbi:MAG: hypothetical protein JXA42_04815 [Anaerolineales bacterium]|nr:hypothetical protein [Anaerolineales bacterium]
MENKVILEALDPKSKKPIAQVVLNGYNIQAGGPLGGAGPMRSFAIMRGSLYEYWSNQLPIMLSDDNGLHVYVRVAALPVERGGMGLFEALGAVTDSKERVNRSESSLEEVG